MTRTLFSPKLVEESFSQEKEIPQRNPYILSKAELLKPPVMEIFKPPFAADSYIDEPE